MPKPHRSPVTATEIREIAKSRRLTVMDTRHLRALYTASARRPLERSTVGEGRSARDCTRTAAWASGQKLPCGIPNSGCTRYRAVESAGGRPGVPELRERFSRAPGNTCQSVSRISSHAADTRTHACVYVTVCEIARFPRPTSAGQGDSSNRNTYGYSRALVSRRCRCRHSRSRVNNNPAYAAKDTAGRIARVCNPVTGHRRVEARIRRDTHSDHRFIARSYPYTLAYIVCVGVSREGASCALNNLRSSIERPSFNSDFHLEFSLN